MDYSILEAELKQYGLIAEGDKVEKEGQLYYVLFVKEKKTTEEWQAAGNFIVNHMPDSEFMSILLKEFYMENLYKAVNSAGKVMDFLWKLVRYYGRKLRWEFFDYEHIVAFAFRFCESLTADDLQQQDWMQGENSGLKEEKYDYFSCVNIGLSYAGENSDIGKAFHGGEMIRKYTPYLDASIVEKLFENAERINGISLIDLRYRFQMIESCKVKEENERRYMQFRYIYDPYFKESLGHFFDGYFAGIGNDIYINTDDGQENKYEEILCYRGNDSGQKCLFAVEKREPDGMTFFISRNDIGTKFQIYLSDERKLVYCCENDTRSYDEVWYTITNNMNDRTKIEDAALNKEFFKIVEEVTDDFGKKFKDRFTKDTNNRLEMLFVYVKSIYGRDFVKSLPFSDEYSYQIEEGEKIQLHLTPQKTYSESRDFFSVTLFSGNGEERKGHITNMNALIGKNGSGKTSITKLLMESEIFGDIFSTKGKMEAEYCIVYRVGENLYYSCTEYEKNWITVSCDGKEVHSYQNTVNDRNIYRNMFNTTVVLYHNIINPLDADSLAVAKRPLQSSMRRDLSTTHILSQEFVAPEFTDIVYVMNFMEDVEEVEKEKAADFFEKFEIKAIQKIKVTNKQEEMLVDRKEFLQKYDAFLREAQEKQRDIKFSIADVSTGESARLLLFARLHSVFHVNGKYRFFLFSGEEAASVNSAKRGNYLLLLDEIEAFFHPTWQRTIVYDFIAFLEWEEKKFSAYDNVHVILSSNSPFFLSDLPKTKLIRLDEDNDWEYRKQTFGENIHTILKDSFLKEDGLMGKFAQRKIEKAFAFLREGEMNDEKWEYVNEVKSLVEEPIIKYALQELYDAVLEKTNDNQRKLTEYEKQIEALQKKMEELQGEQ